MDPSSESAVQGLRDSPAARVKKRGRRKKSKDQGRLAVQREAVESSTAEADTLTRLGGVLRTDDTMVKADTINSPGGLSDTDDMMELDKETIPTPSPRIAPATLNDPVGFDTPRQEGIIPGAQHSMFQPSHAGVENVSAGPHIQ